MNETDPNSGASARSIAAGGDLPGDPSEDPVSQDPVSHDPVGQGPLKGQRNNRWTTRESIRQRLIANLPRLLPRRATSAGQPSKRCGILTYHRIADPISGLPFPTSNVTPRRFQQQLSGLLQRGFIPWRLQQVIDSVRADQPIPPGVFVVTFDDGYRNNFTHAYPILRQLQIPATIFVCTAYLDREECFPFEDWEAATSDRVPGEQVRPLTTQQCQTMLDEGLVEIGSHTHTHADFRGSPQRFDQDLRRSLQVLGEKLGVHQPTFAFPFGKRATGFAAPELAGVAEQAGLLCGLTSENELTDLSHDRFGWSRFTATQADNGATLAAKLDGRYDTVRSLWRRLRQLISLH